MLGLNAYATLFGPSFIFSMSCFASPEWPFKAVNPQNSTLLPKRGKDSLALSFLPLALPRGHDSSKLHLASSPQCDPTHTCWLAELCMLPVDCGLIMSCSRSQAAKGLLILSSGLGLGAPSSFLTRENVFLAMNK